MADKTIKNEYQTWIFVNDPPITAEQARKITKKATIFQKFRLLFHRSEYSVDGDFVIRYKVMGNELYVMKRGTKI